LLAAANAGETVVVTKHGRAIAEIIAPQGNQMEARPDLGWLRAERVIPLMEPLESAALIRPMRDGDA
jgi:antitoxin (DNA-binding transcriptional repressor) of toxin-antitoxin stability system